MWGLLPSIRVVLLYLTVHNLFLIDVLLVSGERRTVNCAAGRITGFIRPVNIGQSRTANITEFLGIPYAEPPVGDQRFRKPIKKGVFQDELLAFSHGASCSQSNPIFAPVTMSEDCLFLNVFTPVNLQSHNAPTPEVTNTQLPEAIKFFPPEETNPIPSNTTIAPQPEVANTTNGHPSLDNTTLLPVMVWIHGGGFIIGDGSIFDGGRLAAFGQVVVVTLNYRLGPFGFLNTGDSSNDGNNGLRDQQVAIEWVYENIGCFGGDRTTVTIFGESSGAAAVMYQMIYPPNKQFIRRVIAESGSANANWALVPDPEHKAEQFAAKLNCPVESKPQMMKCLREEKNLTKMAVASYLGGQDWNPSLDNDFVTLDRIRALDDAATLRTKLPHLHQIDLMMGTNGFDGQSFLPIPLYLQEYLSIINQSTPLDQIRSLSRNIYLKALTTLYPPDIARRVVDAADFEYTYHEDPNNRNLVMKQSSDFMTDLQYLFPAFKSLESHAFNNTISTTFQYEFNELLPFLAQDPWIDGALHAHEMPYVFGLPRSLEKYFNYTQADADIHWDFTTQIMNYWTNFVKTGNPNKPRTTNTAEWKAYTVTNKEYMYLTSSLTESRSHLHGRHISFWSHYLPRVVSDISAELERENLTCPNTVNTGSSAVVNSVISIGFICYYLIQIFFRWHLAIE